VCVYFGIMSQVISVIRSESRDERFGLLVMYIWYTAGVL